MKHSSHDKFSRLYNRSTYNLIIAASVIIIFSIIITGLASYNNSKKAVVDKLKTNDLIYIIKSIRSEIDGRIERAKETSLLIADDPVLQAWFQSREQDLEYQMMVAQKVEEFNLTFDYSNIFMANDLTKSYWNNGKLIDVLKEDDIYDKWYFETINSQHKINLNIDYNKELNDTFLWVNTLVGDKDRPLGIAGIGLDLQEVALEFTNYKISENSNLWLVNQEGVISLSEDIEHSGENIGEYIPLEIKQEIQQRLLRANNAPGVKEYFDEQGQLIDLIYQPLQSCSWMLVFQVPRDEVIEILDSMKINTIATVFITIIAIIFIFYLISSRIANPYKRALLVNEELERIVQERTDELTAKNNKLMDSINYAQKMQESILPTSIELSGIFTDHFVIWKPRDTVGGDFYWLKKREQGHILVLADCTGHGVPGALLTMALNSILNNIVATVNPNEPAEFIKELDRLIKQHLNKGTGGRFTDDGLEAGVCFIGPSGEVTFAGVGIDLYAKNGSSLLRFKGIRKGIGYQRTNLAGLANQNIPLEQGGLIYLTTDGYLDQNGGSKNYSLGRKKFSQLINAVWHKSLAEQKEEFLKLLKSYQGQEPQRDDITVLGCKINQQGGRCDAE